MVSLYHSEVTYKLELTGFQGPLEKLLELIEEKKLEITTVSLAEVTGGFFEYLHRLEAAGANHSLVADFLVVASKLLLIKSKTLLPSLELTEEEESDIKNLETRLKLYQELKKTREYIKMGWHPEPMIFSRAFLMERAPIFYPPRRFSKEDLAGAVRRVVGELERFMHPVVRVKNEIIHLKQKIEEIFAQLTERPVSFKSFGSGSNGRSELVVLFLAILHLVKEQLVMVEQGSHFSDIFIARKKREEVQ